MSQRVEEEVNRLNSYLYPSTLSAVMQIIEEVFLAPKIDDIYNETNSLLNGKGYKGEMIIFSNRKRISFELFGDFIS